MSGPIYDSSPTMAPPIPPTYGPSPAPTEQPPAQQAPRLPDNRFDEQRTEAGKIVLQVAHSAKVTINNRPTRAEGTERVYLSQLKPGATYRFKIQVEEGGQVVRREVMLEAGQIKTFQLQGGELAAR